MANRRDDRAAGGGGRSLGGRQRSDAMEAHGNGLNLKIEASTQTD